ncbi:hypothetical protein TKK_0015528 [Trichogramma kaykai]
MRDPIADLHVNGGSIDHSPINPRKRSRRLFSDLESDHGTPAPEHNDKQGSPENPGKRLRLISSDLESDVGTSAQLLSDKQEDLLSKSARVFPLQPSHLDESDDDYQTSSPVVNDKQDKADATVKVAIPNHQSARRKLVLENKNASEHLLVHHRDTTNSSGSNRKDNDDHRDNSNPSGSNRNKNNDERSTPNHSGSGGIENDDQRSTLNHSRSGRIENGLNVVDNEELELRQNQLQALVEEVSNEQIPYAVRGRFVLYRLRDIRNIDPDDLTAMNVIRTPEGGDDVGFKGRTNERLIYLGAGKAVDVQFWEHLKRQPVWTYSRESAQVLWSKRVLVNRCIKESKISIVLQNRSPLKQLTPSKYNVLRDLFNDYLDEKEKYRLKKQIIFSKMN